MAGEPASASEVNNNFNAVADGVNSNDARIVELESQLQQAVNSNDLRFAELERQLEFASLLLQQSQQRSGLTLSGKYTLVSSGNSKNVSNLVDPVQLAYTHTIEGSTSARGSLVFDIDGVVTLSITTDFSEISSAQTNLLQPQFPGLLRCFSSRSSWLNYIPVLHLFEAAAHSKFAPGRFVKGAQQRRWPLIAAPGGSLTKTPLRRCCP